MACSNGLGLVLLPATPGGGRTHIATLCPVLEMRKWRHENAEPLAEYYLLSKGAGTLPPGVRCRLPPVTATHTLPSYQNPLRFLRVISLGGNEFHNSISVSLLLRPLKPNAGIRFFTDPPAPVSPPVALQGSLICSPQGWDTHLLPNSLHILSLGPICFCLSP